MFETTLTVESELLRLRQELDRCHEDLNVCAVQISHDFEELTFLRTLAEHLDVSDPSLGAWHVAELVLPLLASVIRAESLVLVPAIRDEDGETTVDRPALWVGPRRLDDADCRRFIDRFRHQAVDQPLVRNRFDESPEGDEFPGVRKFVITSLAKGDFLVGWIAAINHAHRAQGEGETLWRLSQFEFGTIEASLLTSVSSMLATHARNVALFREKEAMLVGVVRAMVSAIDAKDPYTCGHSERVALVARRVAEEMGLPAEQCEAVYLSALMHDLGKIGVPDAVLRKPGQLSPEEFAEIRPHPEQGWLILEGVAQFRNLLPGVLHHHEQYDGEGYPDGLAGEAIPMIARVIAVADSYDAMISDRPYRKGMPEELVEQVLREGAGKQWDPTVIEAFFRAIDDVRRIWASYRPGPAKRRVRRGPVGRGFSMVEMVIVILILGIMAAVAVPRFADATARRRVEEAARRVEADLTMARREAAARDVKQNVSFDPAGGQYAVVPGPRRLDGGGGAYAARLADPPYQTEIVSAQFGSDRDVLFSRNGMPDSGGTVVLRSGGHKATVTVDGAGGTSRMVE